MRGILDYLSESFKGPVVIAESSAGDTKDGYDNFKYTALTSEYRRQQLKLIDLNDEAKFERVALLDSDLHIVPCRIAARLVDPEAFVISACMLKTHNTVIASLSIKNMVLGAPLHQATGENPRWNDKRKFHVGLRQTHYNMMVTAQRLNWGASLIDGYEGHGGQRPEFRDAGGVAHRPGVHRLRGGRPRRRRDHGHRPRMAGLREILRRSRSGPVRRSKIDVIGAKVADVKKSYRMHPDIERELKWQGPLTELPFNLGWVQALSYTREG
jgi:hypothetical protein